MKEGILLKLREVLLLDYENLPNPRGLTGPESHP